MRTPRLRLTAVAVVFAARRGRASDRVAAPAPAASDDRRVRDALDKLNGDLAAQRRLLDVLNGRLRGVRVLVVSTRSGSSDVDGVVTMLAAAGATVSGRVELSDAYLDPANAADLAGLASRTRPPSLTGDLPADGVAASTALLAAVLLARTPAASQEEIAGVLTAYAGKGYLRLGTPEPVPGDAVVLVGGGSAGNVLLAAVGQLRRAAPMVVADEQVAGVVAQVRADPVLSSTVSTVDNVATPPGRLVMAWALADQIAGRTGHYGTGEGAAPLPS